CASGVGSRKRLRFKAGVAEMNVRSIAPPPRPAPSPTVGAGKKESSSSNATDAASTLLRSAQSVKAMRGSLGGTVLTPVVLQLGCSLGWCASIAGKMLNDGSDGLRNS